MRCNVCGAQLDDGTKTCPYCGCATEGDGKEITVYTASDASAAEGASNNANATISPAFMADSSVGREVGPSVGLKWAHFLGYFALWISALVNIYSAVSYFTGAQYELLGTTAERVYETFGNGLKYADLFCGIGLVAIAVLAAMAATAIVRYKSTAGTLLGWAYVLNAIVPLAYLTMFSTVVGVNAFTAKAVVSIALSLAFVFINKIYFDKRKHIFVN